ncbi:hypothetical protein C0J52_09944 [Blattella germanica]|nr:hypothetical protein C0J52_09944 [Blattella germanica]
MKDMIYKCSLRFKQGLGSHSYARIRRFDIRTRFQGKTMGLQQCIFLILTIFIFETITNTSSANYRRYRGAPNYRHYRGAPYSIKYGDNDVLKQPYDNAHGAEGPHADILFTYKNPDVAPKHEASIIIDSKDIATPSVKYLVHGRSIQLAKNGIMTPNARSIFANWENTTCQCGMLTLQPNCRLERGKGPTYPSCCPSLFCTGKYQGPTLDSSDNK